MARATKRPIKARPCADDVVTRIAGDRVIAGATQQSVIARTPVDRVIARMPVHIVGPIRAKHGVIPAPADKTFNI